MRSEERPERAVPVHWEWLVVLLAAPALAVFELAARVNVTLLLCYLVGASVVAGVMCAMDKTRAQNRQWRIPESTLHLVELAGGWPGSFVAQRWCRHKVSKRRYQVAFWLIVAGHQILALGYVFDWKPVMRFVAGLTKSLAG